MVWTNDHLTYRALYHLTSMKLTNFYKSESFVTRNLQYQQAMSGLCWWICCESYDASWSWSGKWSVALSYHMSVPMRENVSASLLIRAKCQYGRLADWSTDRPTCRPYRARTIVPDKNKLIQIPLQHSYACEHLKSVRKVNEAWLEYWKVRKKKEEKWKC